MGALKARWDGIPLEELIRLVRAAQLSLTDVADYLRFDAAGFQDTLICRGNFELRCLCWQSSQHSSIHNHGGSRCVVQVMKGTLTNTDFECDGAGSVRAVATYDLKCGAVNAKQNQEIHQLANSQADGAVAVSLHIYESPRLESNRFRVRPEANAR